MFVFPNISLSFEYVIVYLLILFGFAYFLDEKKTYETLSVTL